MLHLVIWISYSILCEVTCLIQVQLYLHESSELSNTVQPVKVYMYYMYIYWNFLQSNCNPVHEQLKHKHSKQSAGRCTHVYGLHCTLPRCFLITRHPSMAFLLRGTHHFPYIGSLVKHKPFILGCKVGICIIL